MKFTIGQLAAQLGLTFRPAPGPDGVDANSLIKGVNTLEAAGPDEISFLSNPKYARFLGQTRAAAVILSPEMLEGCENPPSALLSANPYLDFARLLSLFEQPQGYLNGVSPLAFIDPAAALGRDCTVYPFAFIGRDAVLGDNCRIFPGAYVGENCVIGKNSVLYPNAVLMAGTRIGEDCIIHAGVVLGADGFGFTRVTPAEGGGIRKVPQLGSTRLGDRVEIGANSTVDRAVLGSTEIGPDSKLDNLVQIGHNVRVGREAIIVSQSGIAGSTTLGDQVTLAAKVGVAGHLKLGNNVTIGPISGLAHDVPDNFTGAGTPLMEESVYLRTLVVTPKLPDMHKKIRKLEREVEELKKLLPAANSCAEDS